MRLDVAMLLGLAAIETEPPARAAPAQRLSREFAFACEFGPALIVVRLGRR
jgi:hypothetical protein